MADNVGSPIYLSSSKNCSELTRFIGGLDLVRGGLASVRGGLAVVRGGLALVRGGLASEGVQA